MAVARGDDDEGVTTLELFFDLVFVFAITQVTALMAEDPTWAGLGRGMLVLSALWFAWAAYAWLTNTINPDEGAPRLAIFATMAALLVASLAAPHAFGDDAVIFGAAYLFVRAMHMVLYALAARADPTLSFVVRQLAPGMLGAGALILAAGLVEGTARYALWIASLLLPALLLFLRGVDGWRLHPSHFAERHGLIVLIAIGESIVAAGIGISGQELDAKLIVAAVLTIAVAAALWWTYFDIGVHVAERRLTELDGAARARMARDSYTFLHLPMVAGVILFALGVKKTLEHVDMPLDTVPAFALCGGLALYFAGQIAFRLRNVRSFSRRRTSLALALLALIPVATQVDALYALAATAVACWGMITYEVLRYREARHRMRHPQEVPA
jgi:low temperature requirement protein LtrA